MNRRTPGGGVGSGSDLRSRIGANKTRGPSHGKQGEIWTEVRSRKVSKKEKLRTLREARLRNATTFFVSNLPAGCSSIRLWRAFEPFENLEDAFVPQKRDGAGNSFGFIRFSGVSDVSKWVSDLKEVDVDGARLGINVAKYSRDGRDSKAPICPGNQYSKGEIHRVHSSGAQWESSAGTRGMRGSFKDALVGKTTVRLSDITVDLPPLVTKAKSVWSRRSLVGEVMDLEKLNSIKALLVRDSMRGAEVRYIGGLKLLLTFENLELADEFRRMKFDVWSQWFSRVYVWEGDPGVFERLAWIEIKGIPACLWDNHVFNRIGERFGRLVKKSEASVNDGNLSLEKLVILCIIKVWVHESEENWTPTFLDNVDKEEEDIDVPFPVAGILTREEGEEKSQNTKSCMGKMHESGVHGKGGKDADIETSPPRLDDLAPEVGPTADNLMSWGELSNGQVVYAFGAQEKSDKDGPVENVLRKKRNSGSSMAQRIRVPRVPDLNVSADDPFNLDKTISAFGAKRNAKRKRRSPDRLNSFSKSEGDPVKKLKEGGLEEVSPELSTESGDANGRSSSPPFVDVEVEKEVQETMAVGKRVGIEMDGFENHLCKLVQGELELNRNS
ncbi:hypothetical protein L1987_58458 [Smallanthus sonchifolius]|uniref:Uncharacterized protein n=1 Tax=Smallanthus sonchifolius TaxID=185202 RepID=A0ACB9DGD0_9ASTR|nr:hypothetical protein L1987_58458 [Smallanthus sonchifolius]